MLAILLAAAMFPAHVVIPFPGAVRLAIIQAAVVAASNGGEGAIFVRHEGGFRRAGSFAPITGRAPSPSPT